MEVRAYSLDLGIIRVCWIIFIIVWSLGVAWTKRTIYRESSAERAAYWLVLVIGYFLVIKSSVVAATVRLARRSAQNIKLVGRGLSVRQRPSVCHLGKIDTREKLERRDHAEGRPRTH